jgi:uncharacterized protein
MLYEHTVPQFAKTLKNLSHFLDKAAAFSETKKIEADVLLQSRLAPDQFNFLRQVQIACDMAKLGCARITGKEAPTHDDKEKTILELKQRIQSTIQFLHTLSANDFKGADEKRVTTPRWEGKTLSGSEFAIHHVIPNFYFHIATAYSILRHNGVDIGKKDFLGDIPFRMP